MYGKVIIGLCIVASTASLVFALRRLSGSPYQRLDKDLPTTTTSKPDNSNFEDVHVCVPSDSCGSKNVVGIKIEYTCSCNSGYAGQYCNNAQNKATAQKPQLRSFADLTHAEIKANQLFYCEYQSTKCINGVTVIQSKTAICG
ncbi:hypothetical protein M3Y97_00728800 [Aphelenchoides bicaudatus]|nr:hypothetical protein M3Y97_00728800 [Aphelenchoides bicaudatus]